MADRKKAVGNYLNPPVFHLPTLISQNIQCGMQPSLPNAKQKAMNAMMRNNGLPTAARKIPAPKIAAIIEYVRTARASFIADYCNAFEVECKSAKKSRVVTQFEIRLTPATC
jgi:hypothetical protein